MDVVVGELTPPGSTHTVRDVLQTLCKLLEENGSESVFLSVTARRTTEHQGSTIGRRFLVCNEGIIQKFKEFCVTKELSLQEQQQKPKSDSSNADDEVIDDCDDVNGTDDFVDHKNNETDVSEETQDTDLQHLQRTEEHEICEICGRKYQSKRTLKKHHQTAHDGVRRNYTCSICGVNFAEKNLLSRHVNHKHTKAIVATCATCGKGFHSIRNLKDHEIVHSGGRYKCPHCHKAFVSKTSMVGHINKHHLKINPYSCTLCTKQFPYQTSLKYHMQTKHGSSASINSSVRICSICCKTFSNTNALFQHRITHEERKFICKTCGKGFKRGGDLTRHEKRHDGLQITLKTSLC